MTHLKVLAEEIGPRPSGSKAEDRAAQYIHSNLQSTKRIESAIHPFAAAADTDWTLAILFGFYYLFGIVAFFDPFLAGIGILIAGFLIFRELSYRPLLSKLFPCQSRNVIGRLSPTSDPKIEIVLSAHLDSGRTAKSRITSSPKADRYSFFIMCIFLISGMGLLGLAGIYSLFWINNGSTDLLIALSFPTTIYAGVTSLFLFAKLKFHKHSVGANDNASGIAVVLETARILSQRKASSASIVFLFSGSEESGLRGILEFLSRHCRDGIPRVFLNIDSCGRGKLAMVTAEGWLIPQSSDPKLRERGYMCAKDLGIDLEEAGRGKAIVSDMAAVLRQGYPGLTITALKEENSTLFSHTPEDTMDRISVGTMIDAVNLLACMTRSSANVSEWAETSPAA
ncbi:MAG: M28 family metallopeptidase [Candidatus Thorarchaeota archaeon]